MQPFGFYAIARKSIFLSYCEKQRHQHFLLSHRADASYYHSIVSNDTRRSYFYVVLQWVNNNNTFFIVSHVRASEQVMTTWYRKEQTSARRIAMSEQFYWHLREKKSIFYTSYSKKRQQQAYFLPRIPKGDNIIACKSMSIIAKTRQHNIFWCCGKQSYCRGATTVIWPSRDARTQQSKFSCCPSKDDSNKHCWSWDNGKERTLVRRIARSDDDKGWLRRGMRDRAIQQPTKKIHRIASTRATSRHPITRRTMISIFCCSIAMSKRRRIHFFRSIVREWAKW